VRYADPTLMVDGEMQSDMAINAKKLDATYPFSTLKGGANILIVPDLQSCNIAARMLTQLGAGELLGPILSGMAKPVHLLQRGAAKVLALDVGTNQLDWKLRRDPRVVSLEKTNARYLTLDQIGTPVSLVTMDVSFISTTLILPALPPLLEPGAELLILVKPQFEVGRGQVGKGGIVRDERLHRVAVEKVCAKLEELGFSQLGSTESILPGVSGNREYFVHGFWRNSPGS